MHMEEIADVLQSAHRRRSKGQVSEDTGKKSHGSSSSKDCVPAGKRKISEGIMQVFADKIAFVEPPPQEPQTIPNQVTQESPVAEPVPVPMPISVPTQQPPSLSAPETLQKIGGELRTVQQQLMATVCERRAELEGDQSQYGCWAFLSNSLASVMRLTNELATIGQCASTAEPQQQFAYPSAELLTPSPQPPPAYQEEKDQPQDCYYYYQQQQIPSVSTPTPFDAVGEMNSYE